MIYKHIDVCRHDGLLFRGTRNALSLSIGDDFERRRSRGQSRNYAGKDVANKSLQFLEKVDFTKGLPEPAH